MVTFAWSITLDLITNVFIPNVLTDNEKNPDNLAFVNDLRYRQNSGAGS